MGAHRTIESGQFVIIREQGAAVTVAAKRFGGKKRNGCHFSQCSHHSSRGVGAKALRRIGDHEEIVLLGDYPDFGIIRG